MAIEDAERTLGQIRDLLRGPELTSVGQLISEVRDAIRGSGQNTVRMAIQDLQKNVMTELALLRDATRGGGGIARPGTPGAPAGGPGGQQQDSQNNTLGKILGVLEEIELDISVIGGRGRGSGMDGGASSFGLKSLETRYRDVDRLIEISRDQSLSMSQRMSAFVTEFTRNGGLISAQYEAHQKQAILGLTSLATKSTDLVYGFEKLSHFIKGMVTEGYQSFQTNRSVGLSGNQTLFDDVQRIITRGISDAGFGYNLTAKAIADHGDQNNPTTLIMGRNVAEMSQQFSKIMQQMTAQGHNPLSTFNPDELMKFIQDQTGIMRQSQIFNKMSPDLRDQYMMRSMVYLGDISKYTGVSASKLEELLKKNDQEANELQAIGAMNPQQRQAYGQNMTMLDSMGGKDLHGAIAEMARARGDIGTFMAITDGKYAVVDQQLQGRFLPLLQSLYNQSIKTQSAQQFMMSAAGAANGMPDLPYSYLSASHGNPEIGQMASALQMLKGLSTESIANYKVPPESDPTKNLLTWIDKIKATFPQLSQLAVAAASAAGAALQFAASLYIASRALGILGIGAGGGFGSTLKGAAIGLGRAAPVVGGVIAGAEDYAETGNVKHAATVGGGTWGGAAAGAAVGAAVGGPFDWATVPIGAIVGAAMGYFGSKSVADAVFPNENMVGPGNAAVGGGGANGSELLQSSEQGNSILMQIHGELARQTGLLAGSPTTNSSTGGYSSQGLANSAPAAADTASGNANVGAPYH